MSMIVAVFDCAYMWLYSVAASAHDITMLPVRLSDSALFSYAFNEFARVPNDFKSLHVFFLVHQREKVRSVLTLIQ